MKTPILKYCIVAVMVFVTSLSFAQEPDAEGCKDHQFFNSLEKYYIHECTENYDEYEFIMSDEKTQTLEARLPGFYIAMMAHLVLTYLVNYR